MTVATGDGDGLQKEAKVEEKKERRDKDFGFSCDVGGEDKKERRRRAWLVVEIVES